MEDDQYLDNENDQAQDDKDHNFAELRKKLRDAEGKASKVEKLERQIVVLESGLKLSPKQLVALTAAHDGEWDPESIQATATELGFAPVDSNSETSGEESNLQISDEERQAHEITDKATGRYIKQPDPEADLMAKIQATESEEELIALLEANPRSDGSSRLRTY